jgi:hypothetical protein
MTKDLFEGAFVGAGSKGFALWPRTDFHRRNGRGFEQKVAKEAKTDQKLGFRRDCSASPSAERDNARFRSFTGRMEEDLNRR